MATLTAGAIVEAVADGDAVFAQGDEADHVLAILPCKGRVRIGSPAASSKRVMVEVFRAKEIFGELAVIDRGRRSADAVADGAVRLMRLRAAQFREVLATEPRLGVNLVTILAGRLRRTYSLFQDASFESLEIRLARQLLYLARVGARRSEHGLRLAGRFRQADLADLLGATTRSIITILNKWRADGVMAYDGDRGFVTLIDQEFFRRLVPDSSQADEA
jgi:CRP-like cAMP-binding protein